MLVSKSIIDDVLFRTATFSVNGKVHILTIGWGLKKAEYWHEETPNDTRFFDIRKNDEERLTRYGIYLGRLCFVWMKGKERLSS